MAVDGEERYKSSSGANDLLFPSCYQTIRGSSHSSIAHQQSSKLSLVHLLDQQPHNTMNYSNTNKPPPPPRPQPPHPQPQQTVSDSRIVDMETTITRLSNDNQSLSAQNSAMKANNQALPISQPKHLDNNYPPNPAPFQPPYPTYNQGQWRWHDDGAEREKRREDRADRKKERKREKREEERERREREVKRTMGVLGGVAF